MITDGYDRCRQRKLSTTLTNSDNDLRRDIRATGMDGWRSMGLEVEICRTGSLLDVFLFLSSLLLLDLGPVQMALARVFTTCQWRWSFPVRRIRRKVAIELNRSVVGLMSSYDCVRRMIVSFFVSLSFFSLILALAAQEVCA